MMRFTLIVLSISLALAQSTPSALDTAIANSPECTTKCAATHAAFLSCNDNQASSSTSNLACGCTESYLTLARACVDFQNVVANQLGGADVLQEVFEKHTVKYNDNVNTCISAGYGVVQQLDAVSSSSMTSATLSTSTPVMTTASSAARMNSSSTSISMSISTTSIAPAVTSSKSNAYKSTLGMTVILCGLALIM